ncbi:MAG: hypothetical protein J6M92_11305 [Oribacterium sp.]|nr:hypothetical protein [Oribacterium sp.]
MVIISFHQRAECCQRYPCVDKRLLEEDGIEVTEDRVDLKKYGMKEERGMEINKPTNELDSILENMKPDQLDAFFAAYGKGVADEKKAFYYYYTGVLKDKRIKLKDVYSFAGESESYGGQIVRMEKRTKDRDVILRLCIVGHFNLEETNRALKLYGMAELYAKNSRDACLIVAISNRIYRLDKIDDMLEKRGLEKITKDE